MISGADLTKEFLMTLLTVRPLNEDSNDDNHNNNKNNQRQFQVPVDADMPLVDLYDIIFSLTDIPPHNLCLIHDKKRLTLADVNSDTLLRNTGIIPPTVIHFSSIDASRNSHHKKEGDAGDSGSGSGTAGGDESKMGRRSGGDAVGGGSGSGSGSGVINEAGNSNNNNNNNNNNNMQQQKQQMSSDTAATSIAGSLPNLTTTKTTNGVIIDKNRLNSAFSMALQRLLHSTPHVSGELNKFMQRLYHYHTQVSMYEDSNQQATALKHMPISRLRAEASLSSTSSSTLSFSPSDFEGLSAQLRLTKVLLRWFKREHFTWVNSPPCLFCPLLPGNKPTTRLVNVEQPTISERRNGKAGRTEVYCCTSCGTTIRFPRFDDAAHLMSVTRRGRCGEWAQAFTLCARAAGLNARMVHDWTDHVWSEIWCPIEQRWIHADSCEESLDQPLLYEKGWGKKLTYCIATGIDSIIDVTAKYTADLDAICTRRNRLLEVPLANAIADYNDRVVEKQLNQTVHTTSNIKDIRHRWMSDIKDMARRRETSGDESIQNGDDLSGRQSGSKEWVKARGEDGSKK